MLKEVDGTRIVLPEKFKRNAPTCWHKDLWFELKTWDPATDRFDNDCIDALIAKGIGDKLQCPTMGRHAAFCVAGGVVAAMTRKNIALPVDVSWRAWEKEEYAWEMLWEAAEAHRETANISFLASVLRGFLPRENYCPPDRPYRRSRFVERWENVAYPLTSFSSVHRLRPECIDLGKKALRRLPAPVVDVINKTATHIPPMLDLVIERIKKTYHW